MRPSITISKMICLLLFCCSTLISQSKLNFVETLLRNEAEPEHFIAAKKIAIELNLPLEIYIENNILIYPATVQNNKPLYAVITNFAHPYEKGYLAFYEEILNTYDLTKARIKYFGQSENSGIVSDLLKSSELLLVPDWTEDRVLTFDPVTGNLVNAYFIPTTSPALQSPKEAVLSPWGFITVSDQISDLVQKFDTSGVHSGWFAPAGGVNTAILDNIRGHAYRPNKNLIVTVASGANQNAIAEFDSAGNFTGNFIPAASGGLNSPFGILLRADDVLITHSSGTTGVRRYDLNGNYLSFFAAISSFPQQIIQLADKTIAVANFSGTGTQGIRLYQPDGTFIRALQGVTGNRGVFQLRNGNFITTNGAGIHEIDFNTGALVRTILPATSLQYINLYKRPSASIMVTSPNGGEVWKVGEQKSITWNQTGIDTVKIEYSTNGGTDWLLITTGTPAKVDEGTYNWTIPNTPTSNSLVKITSKNNPTIFDVSDSSFTIQAAPLLNEIEPNNTPATANTITLGTALDATLSPSGDVDWFRFTAPVGHLIVDATDVSNVTDVDLYLYDSTGTKLLYNVDRNINDRLEYNLKYTGTYFINVKGYQNATGLYTLFARIAPGTDHLEPDDGPLFGFPMIATWVESLYRDSLSTINPGVGLPGFDIDYRYINMAAGQVMRVTLKTKSIFPATTMNGGYVGIGRKGSAATLFPQLFGGLPLASGFSTTGTDVTVDHTITVTDTYYVFVSVHLQSPSPYGFNQAGPNAKYQIIIDRTVGVGDVTELPKTFELNQNYPNPFNPTTQIKFSLPEASFVSLDIHNFLGQKIKTLVQEERKAGVHISDWNGTNESGHITGSGVYYVRISANSNSGKKFQQTRKMILIK